MRILIVAMPHSIHVARYVSQLVGRGWDIHLFPATGVPPHYGLRDITFHDAMRVRPGGMDPSVRVVDEFWPVLPNGWPLPRGRSLARRLIRRWFPKWDDPAWHLANTIRKLKPDVIHTLEIHLAGGLVLRAKNFDPREFPPWIVTNWGGDIYLQGRQPEKAEYIRSILSSCDYYTCECDRDVKLAQQFGFQKEALLVAPNAGGFDLQRIRHFRQPGPTSARRVIALKGYQGLAGRALVGLRAIELAADVLKGYRVLIYSATNTHVQFAAMLVSQSTGLSVETVPERSHDDMLRLHGRARISIGLSMGDGISTSFLEALVMGSFPIQSHTSCANEWIQPGITGLLVHPEDPAEIAAAIKRAITNDQLVDEAAEANEHTAREHLDYLIIQQQYVAMYEKVKINTKKRCSCTEALSDHAPLS